MDKAVSSAAAPTDKNMGGSSISYGRELPEAWDNQIEIPGFLDLSLNFSKTAGSSPTN